MNKDIVLSDIHGQYCGLPVVPAVTSHVAGSEQRDAAFFVLPTADEDEDV